MNDFRIKETLFILLPIFPLLDFFAPYHVPYLSISVYFVLILVFWSREFEYYPLLIYYTVISLLSICFSVLANGVKAEQIYYIVVLFTFFMLGVGIGTKEKRYIDMLYKMVLLYFCINTCIYFFRLVLYGFDFSRVRGGISIYGGNSAHFIYLIMLFLLKYHEEKRQAYYLMLGISVVNAVMFVSKGAIIITLIWIIMDMIHYKDSKIFSKGNLMIGTAAITAIIAVCFLKKDFLSYIVNRFAGWTDSFQTFGNMFGVRGLIFEYSVDYLMKNPIYLFFGIGPSNYSLINPWSYSNPHNLFLDVLLNIGLFGFLLFGFLVLKTFWYTRYKLYYIVCIVYATLEGVALFFVDSASRIVTGYAFMFLVIIYIYSKDFELNNC